MAGAIFEHSWLLLLLLSNEIIAGDNVAGLEEMGLGRSTLF